MAALLLVLALIHLACEPAQPPPSPTDATPRPALADAAGSLEMRGAESESELVGAAPVEGMVLVPGGEARIGSESAVALPHERPAITLELEPFYLDRSPVTVAEFARFAEETGYRTQAEAFGNGAILDLSLAAWRLADGATWRSPRGTRTEVEGEDHPVTQVSWNDAAAYCAWRGARLPTEFEWEHAARGADPSTAAYRQRYAWGERLVGDKGTRANTWTGTFPNENTGADGYVRTSPVGAFGETDLSLTDMGGNVWEWTDSWYRPYADVAAERVYRPAEQSERVQRGGSYLCHDSYCHGYRVSARNKATPETSLEHVGFRCAASVSASR